MLQEITMFWFRRDLRLEDNTGLYFALKENKNVLPIFIFDTEILKHLHVDDARVTFIYKSLISIQEKLKKIDRNISIYQGKPKTIFEQLIKSYSITKVYTNHDYEIYAQNRDSEIEVFLNSKHIEFKTYKDHVFFEKNEVVKADGNPYLVYTPFKNKWKEIFRFKKQEYYPSENYLENIISKFNFESKNIEDLGFVISKIKVLPLKATPSLIESYEDTRNFPALEYGTSKAGPHLRFGTISIRKLLKKAIAQKNEVFLNELIWREFFIQILWHFPYTQNQSFKPKYDHIQWRNNTLEFERWKTGTTGYPLVDAGMRELNQTGYMHNRVRMVVGSFLCKHLLIDWRWGEAYFAEKLLDYDMASNVGNWQWVSGCGVDAAPYFRIFNPTTQIQKFDKNHKYIQKWVNDVNELTYPKPIVDHKVARERCLTTYNYYLKNYTTHKQNLK